MIGDAPLPNLRALAREARRVRLDAPEAVPSPCLNVCRMNEATGFCEGCRRSLHEIAAWSSLDAPARRAVWLSIEARLSAESTA